MDGQTVTNAGLSNFHGHSDVSPGTAATEFPPGIVGGQAHPGNAQAAQAQFFALSTTKRRSGQPLPRRTGAEWG